MEARRAAGKPRAAGPTRYLVRHTLTGAILGMIAARDRDLAARLACERWTDVFHEQLALELWTRASDRDKAEAKRREAWLTELIPADEITCRLCGRKAWGSMRREFARLWECGCQGL